MFHYLHSVGPKQFSALAHLGYTRDWVLPSNIVTLSLKLIIKNLLQGFIRPFLMGVLGQAGLDMVKWRGFRAKKGFASSMKTGLSLGILAGVFKVRQFIFGKMKYFQED